jgi:hypothetical protein
MDKNIEKLKKKLLSGEFLTPFEMEEVVENSDKEFAMSIKNKIIIGMIFKHHKLNESEIRELVSKREISYSDLDALALMQKLSEDFMEDYKDRLSWTILSINQEMSINFINKFVDYLDFTYLPFYQKDIPVGMLENRQVGWEKMSRDFPLSEDFIMTYLKFLDKNLLKKNKNIELTSKIELLLKLS